MPKREFDEAARPLAYFISFRCYGTWLHGDARGSVDRSHNRYGTPFLSHDELREYEEFQRLNRAPVTLDTARRTVVEQTVREVCQQRQWLLHALNVRTNHVHSVITAGREPEDAMNDLKAYATRRMREAGVLPPDQKPWSRHGSTRWLWTPHSLACAIDYVLNCQGDELPNFAAWEKEED
ncbi:MAG: transposase [Acidobacteria bacterium]|nr:transposase [Acidobacteriota bacterium]MBI3425134.1 transposase [Acidobacteriota bacterium]